MPDDSYPEPQILHAIETPTATHLSSRSVTMKGWCFDYHGQPLRGMRARIGDREFKVRRKHARFAVGAPSLPLGCSVEIDAVFEIA